MYARLEGTKNKGKKVLPFPNSENRVRARAILLRQPILPRYGISPHARVETGKLSCSSVTQPYE